MRKNRYLGDPDRHHSNLLGLLSNQLHKNNNIEFLEALEEMSSSNIETSAYAIQSLGELLAHYSIANNGNIEFDDTSGWLINYLGQYIETYSAINDNARARIIELQEKSKIMSIIL
ncbi:MAG: hypothetical protein KZQ83_17470 [gamma proteobacterium symbiont of Taylorina sp.]|nr:hypothetical protein [gamma proteobacterium symbiont of Taylorina sp.]